MSRLDEIRTRVVAATYDFTRTDADRRYMLGVIEDLEKALRNLVEQIQESVQKQQPEFYIGDAKAALDRLNKK